jgi:hypothetical protein
LSGDRDFGKIVIRNFCRFRYFSTDYQDTHDFPSRAEGDSNATMAGFAVTCGGIRKRVRVAQTRATAGLMTERVGSV